MRRRPPALWIVPAYALLLSAAGGCTDHSKSSAPAGSAGPRLTSTDPAERAAAAREAAEKYGAKP